MTDQLIPADLDPLNARIYDDSLLSTEAGKTYRRCAIYEATLERKKVEFIDRYYRAVHRAASGHLDISVVNTLKLLAPTTELVSWETSSLGLHIYYATRAIEHLGFIGFTFTVNLSEDRAGRASHHREGSARHLYRELNGKLKRALGRAPAFYFCQEILGKPTPSHPSAFKPHLHGCIGLLHESELPVLRAILKSVGSGYRCPQTAVHTARIRDHGRVGWSIYCLKQIYLTSFRVPGAPSACSQLLTRTGKELYQRDLSGMRAAGLIVSARSCRSNAPALQ